METQRHKVKNYLQNNGKITGIIALKDLGIYRLSEYIRRLRDEGMAIKTVMETDPNTGKEYGAYYFELLSK